MKNSLILIRHGRSLYNVRETNCLDSDLTDFGITQARIVGKFLKKKIPFLDNYVFHISPFKRCLSTAHYIIDEIGNLNSKFIVDPSISEYLSSDYYDKSVIVPNRKNEFPLFDWGNYSENYTHLPESGEEFVNRMKNSYLNLSDNSIVIAHGLSIIGLGLEAQESLSSMPLWDHSINNCSLTWFKEGEKKWWGRNLFHEYV